MYCLWCCSFPKHIQICWNTTCGNIYWPVETLNTRGAFVCIFQQKLFLLNVHWQELILPTTYRIHQVTYQLLGYYLHNKWFGRAVRSDFFLSASCGVWCQRDCLGPAEKGSRVQIRMSSVTGWCLAADAHATAGRCTWKRFIPSI